MKPAMSRRTLVGRAAAFGGLLLCSIAQAQVPTAPTNLAASAASTTQINLSWTDNSNNETNFKIERKTNTTNFSQVATVGANVTTFSDTGLTSATTYTYRVRASNSSGNSAYTNTAAATTQGQDTTPPTTPGGVTATPESPSQVNLTWNASTDAVGVTGYLVERCQGANCTSFAQIATPTATSLSDTGLAASTAYRYRVRATDAAGNLSPYSSVQGATTSSTGPIGAWGLNGVLGTTQADYSGNNNRGTVAGVVSSVAGQFGNALLFSGLNTWVDLGNPSALQMTGSMTVSAWINSSSFPINDAAIVSKRNDVPQGFQLDTTVDTGPRTIGFKLGAPGGASMSRYGATVLQLNQWYHVAGVYDAGAQTLTVYLNGAPDNGTLAGPVAGRQVNPSLDVFIGRRASNATDYNFSGTIDELRIYNRALTQAEIQADMGAAIAPPAPDTSAPTAPTLAASVMSPTQVHLELANSSDNFDVTAYRVERCQGATCGNFAEVAVGGAKVEDTGLTTGATYSYRARAADGAGNLSGYSNVATATPSASATGALVGSYTFEEGTGGVTADFSGYGNTGALQGTINWTTAGKNGNALSFGGGNVDLGNPGTLQITGSMTVSAWINSSTFPNDDAAIVSKRTGGSNIGFQLDTTIDQGPRTIGFKLTTPAGDRMYRYGGTPLQLNTWYHVAGVYDAQAQTMNVYLNGVLDNGPTVGTVASSQMDSPLDVFVGRRPGVGGFEFNGTIDDVRIYSRALSQAEIQADMSTPAAGGGGTPPDTTPPSAPSALGATAASATQINLSWTASTDNVAVTGYLLERCQGAGCSNFAQIATPASTTFSDSNLTAATSYSYRVRATDAAANLSAYSNVASASTPAAGQAQMYFIHPDHLNTPRMIANQAATTVWRNDNTEPFGNSVPNGDPNNTGVAFDFPLRFPGQYFDAETNLAYNVFRDYDSTAGRYVESDPIGLRGGTNTYLYVRGYPIGLGDPTGLFWPELEKAAKDLTKDIMNSIIATPAGPITGKAIGQKLCEGMIGTPKDPDGLCRAECLNKIPVDPHTGTNNQGPGVTKFLEDCISACIKELVSCKPKPSPSGKLCDTNRSS
jgi:RHS repeat-associated protein